MSSFSERKLVAPIPFPFLFEWIIMEAKSESPKSLLNQMGCCLKENGACEKKIAPFCYIAHLGGLFFQQLWWGGMTHHQLWEWATAGCIQNYMLPRIYENVKGWALAKGVLNILESFGSIIFH